jgi:hypothetical protein
MNAPPKSVVQKRRGRPPNPCINSVISLRLGADLELQLEHLRNASPIKKSPAKAGSGGDQFPLGTGTCAQASARSFLAVASPILINWRIARERLGGSACRYLQS